MDTDKHLRTLLLEREGCSRVEWHLHIHLNMRLPFSDESSDMYILDM